MFIGKFKVPADWTQLSSLIGAINPALTYQIQNTSGQVISCMDSLTTPDPDSLDGILVGGNGILALYKQGTGTLWIRAWGKNTAEIGVSTDE